MDPEEGSTKTADDSGYAEAGADQAEAFANDPANSSTNHVDDLKDKTSSGTESSPSRMSQLAGGAKSFMGSKNAKIGGAGVGIAGLLIAGVLALLPLKLEAIMKNIFQKRIGNKIEHMEERRADRVVLKYLTKAGSNEAVYADGTLFGSLYKNWRLKNFEGKFSAKSGIKIEKLPNGSGIKLTTSDGLGPKTFTESQFEDYMNKDLKGLDARRFIRDVTKSETHWIQVYKRHNLRKFMKNAYGIHKWSWFTGKEGKDPKLSGDISKIALEPYSEETPRVIGCALEGSSCPSDELGREKPYGPDPAPHEKPKSATGDKGTSDLTQGISEAVDEAGKEVAKEAAKNSETVVSKALTKALTPIIGEKLTSTFTTKFIPIVGQILLVDMLARIDHFLSSGSADTAMRSIHKVQYATTFASYASMADNFKDPGHKMSGDEVNTVMTKLGDPSSSAGFQEIFLNKSGGKGLDPSLGIDDRGKSTPIKDNYSTNALIISGGSVGILRAWYSAVDETYAHYIIQAVNSVLGYVVDLAVKLFNAASGGLLDKATSFLGKYLGKFMMYIITPAVDGSEKDGDLFSAIDAGGAVTGQDFSKSLGGHKLSTTQTYAETTAIAYDQKVSSPSLIERLFSKDYPTSLLNQFAVIAPHSPREVLTGFSTYGMAVMKNPFNMFSGMFSSFTNNVYAGGETNIYGLQNYGYTEAELDQPLTTLTDRNHDGKINSDDCKTNEDGTPFSTDQMKDFNDPNKPQICLLDVATAESLGAAFTSENDGGVGDSSTTSSTPSTGAPGILPTGTQQELARQILGNPSITFDSGPTGRIAQPFIDLAGGSKASTLDAAPATDVSTTILGAILLAAQTHKINISSLTTGHSVGDVHSVGRAVDFNYVDGVHSTGRNATDTLVINLLASVLPKGSGFGQTADPNTHISCGPQIVLPAGIIQFEDTCTHIHIQVPTL